jgi:hypothetical protein
MRFDIFVFILLLMAFTSSGEQTFLSQEESNLILLPLQNLTISGKFSNFDGYFDIVPSKEIGQWGDEFKCEKGHYACGLVYQLHEMASDILQDIGLRCCDSKGVWKYDIPSGLDYRQVSKDNSLIQEFGISINNERGLVQRIWYRCKNDFGVVPFIKDIYSDSSRSIKVDDSNYYLCGVKSKYNTTKVQGKDCKVVYVTKVLFCKVLS